MIAAVLTKPGIIELQDTPEPQPKPNQVKIKLQGCGICASSLPLWEGREWFSYPSEPGAPGHEGWGIVTETGEGVNDVMKGDRVAFLSSHAFAEYDVASKDELVILPAEFTGIPFPGEPLGCAMNIFERSDIKAEDTVAIIGTGFLGAILCQLAKNKGAKVIAISRRSFSLDVAKKLGADELIPFSRTWDTASQITEITKGVLCNRVIEATGKQEALDLATEIVAEGGRIIIAGYHQDGLRHVNMQKWNWKGIDVINAHERDTRRYLKGMRGAIEAVQQGIVTPADLFTHNLPLKQINEGFRLTSTRPDGFVKALIQLQ